MSNITVKRGDTHNYNINIKNSEGNPIDCTDWEIKFTVRKYLPKTSIVSDGDALISKTLSGTSSGVIALNLSKIDTNIDFGNWYYDIQITNSTGVHSSSVGNFIVEADITRG